MRILLDIIVGLLLLVGVLCLLFSHYENLHGVTKSSELLNKLHIPFSSDQIIFIEVVCALLGLVLFVLFLNKNK